MKYLKNSTGGNKVWPVKCSGSKCAITFKFPFHFAYARLIDQNIPDLLL